MLRRQVLTLTGASVPAALAGCAATLSGAEIHETVYDEGVFNTDLEEGDHVRLELDNPSGMYAGATLDRIGSDDILIELYAETEDEGEATIPATDTYRVHVFTDGRATVKLFVND